MLRLLRLTIALAAGTMVAPAFAQPTLHNGEQCGLGNLADTKVAEAGHGRCLSGRCFPGPGPGGVSLPFYCIAVDRHCALSGGDGGDANSIIDVNGSKFRCQDPGGANSMWRYGPG